MRARPLLAGWFLFATALACGRSELLELRRPSMPDGGVPDATSTVPPDAAAPTPDASLDAGRPRPDAGRPPMDGGTPRWDAGTCTQSAPWKLESRAVVSARLAAERFATPRTGASVMLEVEVQLLSACEELARVDLASMPGDATDFVTLRAYAWVEQVDGCEPEAPLVTTAVQLPGRGQGNFRVVVSDGSAPNQPYLLAFELTHCSTGDCWCDAWAPPGPVPEFGACQTDCDCAQGLACLPSLSAIGTWWSCMRPCARHTDCPESGCGLANEYAPYVCGSLDACPYPEDCPAGFSCVIRDSPSFCQDERQAPTSMPCTCDAQCPPGQRCLLGFRETPTCEIPCADSQDCPFDWFACGTAAICVPLED